MKLNAGGGVGHSVDLMRTLKMSCFRVGFDLHTPKKGREIIKAS
jgi:hypothetical protein